MTTDNLPQRLRNQSANNPDGSPFDLENRAADEILKLHRVASNLLKEIDNGSHIDIKIAIFNARRAVEK